MALVILASALQACGVLTKYNETIVTPPDKPQIAEADTALTDRCPAPVFLGEDALSQSEVEAFWSIDRANLVRCTDRHSALNTFIQERDNGLASRGDR